MLKNSENNGTEEIGLVTPTPGGAGGTLMSCPCDNGDTCIWIKHIEGYTLTHILLFKQNT